MNENLNGIAIAGSILLDKIYEISAYPTSGELTQIRSINYAVGGCVPNVAIDIKKMLPSLDVLAVGKIGKDEEGEFITRALSENGVDISHVKLADTKTSFTDVMSVKGGQRTFFTYPGASSHFGYSDIDFSNLSVKMFHLGYFLLLDKIDNGDGIKILHEASERGIKTSIDLVSENSDRYSLVIPCLKYTDNLIINETEAGMLTGIEPTNENLELIAKSLMELGVRERVIIHKPDVGVCLSKNGFTAVMSYSLPDGFIKGTTGAGDAFCAGALIGIYEDKTDKEILEFASAAAVMALSAADATSGIQSAENTISFCSKLDRKQQCL